MIHSYFYYSFLILFLLLGCADTKQSTKEGKGANNSDVFDFESQGKVEKDSNEEGYSYQESEYEEYKDNTYESDTESYNNTASQNEDNEENESELLPIENASGDSFQIALIQKSHIRVLVNISNGRALKKKVFKKKNKKIKSKGLKKELNERLKEKFGNENEKVKEGSFVYVGNFRPKKGQRKNLEVYFTGDREAKELKEDVQKLHFHRWSKISLNELKNSLGQDNLMLCEMNGNYYKIERPAPGLAKSSEEHSQRLTSYASAKQQFMIKLQTSLAIPKISSSYKQKTFSKPKNRIR